MHSAMMMNGGKAMAGKMEHAPTEEKNGRQVWVTIAHTVVEKLTLRARTFSFLGPPVWRLFLDCSCEKDTEGGKVTHGAHQLQKELPTAAGGGWKERERHSYL